MRILPAHAALLSTALAACATAPRETTEAAPTAPPYQMVCRVIATPAADDVNPVFCGTAELVTAVEQRPELLNSGVYCQKVETARTGHRAAPRAAPVCMLPEQWNRFNIAGASVYPKWEGTDAREGAREYGALTQPSITNAPPFTPPMAPPTAPTSP